MRLGVYVGGAGSTLEEMIGQACAAADAGLDSAFFSQITAWDALTVAALAGQRVPGIELGTAVVQTYPRHPLVLAGQALTAQVATGHRVTLGVGPSHRHFIEGAFGHSYDQPARHTREYLSALRPLLRGEHVEHRGSFLTVAGQVEVPGATAVPVLLAALGPVMLRVAGELADGTVTVWAGPEAIAGHVVPTITRAAAAAGRPAPRIVAAVPISVTADPEGVRQAVEAHVGFAASFPAYRTILARDGRAAVRETVVAGDEATVASSIRQFADAGVTDLLASLVGSDEDRRRTLRWLGSRRRADWN
ncbi:TIGR03564 family F420-dependent LLM class oxidoreductase [Parafrankia sp. Ea1.12]|uniref:TIGR03564 family F420-dependent LLM class oxidoreductase n=1 Tax=unclassified Parafrankia TaxID=2994368 RepID=UPI000DA51241|nr:TIGR03564 family F420-dependent LLM class oxidoreductase [Parafrankia sp. BMG5.11]SQD99294.1 Luciferase family protein [Parafrankia sp. Ea1.12]